MVCPVCQGAIPEGCPNPTACMEYDRQRRVDALAAAEAERLSEMEAHLAAIRDKEADRKDS
jgi:hypothetical protein